MFDLLISILAGTRIASKLPPHLPEPHFRIEIEPEEDEGKTKDDDKGKKML